MDIFLHQRCPPISIYSSHILCGTHKSAWHIYLTGWDLKLFLFSYFLLRMETTIGTAIEKLSHTWQKFSKGYDTMQLQNQEFKINTLRERKCSRELVFSKDVLKNFANFTGKHPCRVKSEPKSLIYPCSLHLYFKRDSFTQLFFSEFCRIFKNSFFRALLGECPWLYIWHI